MEDICKFPATSVLSTFPAHLVPNKSIDQSMGSFHYLSEILLETHSLAHIPRNG